MGRQRTGSVVNRKGAFYARVSYVDEFGKRREITRKALDRADAQRIIAELHARLDQHGGEAAANDRSTLSTVVELYRAEKAQPAVVRDGRKIAGLKSHYTFGLMLDVIVEHLGHKKLRDIKPADLHRYKQKRLATPTQYGKPRTVAAVNRELEALRSVCRWAVSQGWLARSPFSYGEVVIIKSHESSRDRVLSHAEEERLLNACTGRRAYLRAIVMMGLDTACRRGELLKLTWAMVNLAQGVVSLPGEITKTGKSRTVPLTPRVIAELEAIREKAKTGNDVLPVFGALDIRFAWASACESAQLEGVRFHDLRHTAITRMVAAGIESALVMKISGHDSMRTFQRYLNPENSTLREVAGKLHDLNAAEWDREGADYVN